MILWLLLWFGFVALLCDYCCYYGGFDLYGSLISYCFGFVIDVMVLLVGCICCDLYFGVCCLLVAFLGCFGCLRLLIVFVGAFRLGGWLLFVVIAGFWFACCLRPGLVGFMLIVLVCSSYLSF